MINKILTKLKNIFRGENFSAVETEILKMIQELEEERHKFKPNSILDRRITEKTGLLLELADRLKINIKER